MSLQKKTLIKKICNIIVLNGDVLSFTVVPDNKMLYNELTNSDILKKIENNLEKCVETNCYKLTDDIATKTYKITLSFGTIDVIADLSNCDLSNCGLI